MPDLKWVSETQVAILKAEKKKNPESPIACYCQRRSEVKSHEMQRKGKEAFRRKYKR